MDSNVSHDKFVLINNVLQNYDHIKEETNNVKTSLIKTFNILIKNVTLLFKV